MPRSLVAKLDAIAEERGYSRARVVMAFIELGLHVAREQQQQKRKPRK